MNTKIKENHSLFHYIKSMLNQAGFELIKIEGGNQKERFKTGNSYMFIQAKKLDKITRISGENMVRFQ